MHMRFKEALSTLFSVLGFWGAGGWGERAQLGGWSQDVLEHPLALSPLLKMHRERRLTAHLVHHVPKR